ncbi:MULTISPECIES: hypothetical protein [Cohaesibacter]|uniref:hypothetical protein n=1 Tax=Cohaesibacter TaxID=655352 RepID=UPI000DEBA0C4|nr:MULTISPECIES: hypothetical protein [Cohaesibacter]TLP46814.1 hypothetical protein FDK21_07260 [Cohaesibacter sp. CAU 1516]
MSSRPKGDLAKDSLNSRFCYWQGSGEARYVFSQIALDDIASFSDCVLILASEESSHPQIQWIGAIEDLTPKVLSNMSDTALMHLSAYVHLLAGGEEERARVVSDLGEAPDRSEFKIPA